MRAALVRPEPQDRLESENRPAAEDRPDPDDRSDAAHKPDTQGRPVLAGPLPRIFFERPVVEVARDLLGASLVSQTAEGTAVVRIVETEAYGGPDDLASHARAGRTRRTAPMFGPAGHAYVYRVYGMHECLNVVAETDGQAGAVLLRAAEPRAGLALMRRRRGRPRDADARLAAGPARLCQALGVDRQLNGHDLTLGRRLWLEWPVDAERPPEEAVLGGPRIGVDYAGEWTLRPWRFRLKGHPSLSRP